jgi:TatD DNase family protein
VQFDIHTHKFDKSLGNRQILNSDLEIPVKGYFSSGIHPWAVMPSSMDELALLEKNLLEPRCLAVGEIGLDTLKGPDSAQQVLVFVAQIQLAEKYRLPVILHCVKAWDEVKRIKFDLASSVPWIYHGFSKPSILEDVLHSDCFISIGSQILTHRSLQNSLINIPVNRLLLETDDHSARLDDIYQKVALLRGLDLEELEIQVEKNIRTIFTKWKIG